MQEVKITLAITNKNGTLILLEALPEEIVATTNSASSLKTFLARHRFSPFRWKAGRITDDPEGVPEARGRWKPDVFHEKLT